MIMQDPIPLSSLRPSEAEIEAARARFRAECIAECTVGDIVEAIDCLDDHNTGVLMHSVRNGVTMSGKSDGLTITLRCASNIAMIVVMAMVRHIEALVDRRIDAYIETYRDVRAAEIAEQGRRVDWTI